ncbi:MAG: hypothetical protein M3258_08235 [Thermoproteota archaeon]|nr:hypothetical protein [Thermoproteota archaeon]
MGFLDKLKRKKDRVVDEVKEQTTNTTTDQNTSPARSEQGSAAGKRIKRYTSEGKPVYE